MTDKQTIEERILVSTDLDELIDLIPQVKYTTLINLLLTKFKFKGGGEERFQRVIINLEDRLKDCEDMFRNFEEKRDHVSNLTYRVAVYECLDRINKHQNASVDELKNILLDMLTEGEEEPRSWAVINRIFEQNNK